MISLHNLGSAGAALHYFAQDKDYTEHQGLEESAWVGKGAQALRRSASTLTRSSCRPVHTGNKAGSSATTS